LNNIIYMVKGIRAVHLVTALFDKIFQEKYGKSFFLILFTKTRWGTVYFAAQRAYRVKQACASLPGEITHSELDIDISDDLSSILVDTGYWKGFSALEMLFRPISSFLSYLEGDVATFSPVYACFLAILFKF
jgi:hypothetical protein